MRTELEHWCQEALGKVRRLAGEPASLYREETSLPHYRAVASYLDRRFGDEVLCRSAFLHGVQPDLLCGLVDEPEVVATLAERERLRALDVGDLNPDEKHLFEVLASLRRATAIILFVAEQLHHLDPAGRLARWSRRFQVRPSGALPDLPAGPSFKYGRDLDNAESFARHVVAPTARFFGLWRECSLVEDAILFFYHRQRFEALHRFCVAESAGGQRCDELVAAVACALPGAQPRSAREVRWEWRHVASLDRQLPAARDTTDWKKLIHRAGYVTVICPDDEDCYRTLGEFHARFAHRGIELHDSMRQAAGSRYRALHTVLNLDEPRSTTGAVAVRILPRQSDRPRFRRVGPATLRSIGERFTEDRKHGLSLRVFAPDGQEVVLPVGATVLDFAYATNSSWVAYLAGATVNRHPVGVLHLLAPHDVVWLEVANTPQPLPAGWEQKVREDSAKSIQRVLKQHHRRLLEVEGRRWLHTQLLGRQICNVPEGDLLDNFIDEALYRYPPRSAPQDTLRRWFLVQLGAFAQLAVGNLPPLPFESDRKAVEDFVDELAHLLNNTRLIKLYELNLPADAQERLRDVKLCGNCRPSRHEQWVGQESADGVLELHCVGAPCAMGVPVSMARITAPVLLFIETSNRVGITAEVLSVFLSYRVNLAEVIAREVGRATAVLRVQLEYVSAHKTEEIIATISGIWGVRRVLRADDSEVPILARHLPPPVPGPATFLLQAPPYICGEEITDDVFFYGMQAEMSQLDQMLRDVLRPGTLGGKSILIQGPKRAGKTSLVLNFLRFAERNYRSVTAHHMASLGVRWPQIERALCIELGRSVGGVARQRVPLPDVERCTLLELTQAIYSQLSCPVVLAIDEAVGLLASADKIEDLPAIKSFHDAIRKQPGLVVLWIGPAAQARRLPEMATEILQKSTSLKVSPLNETEVAALLGARKQGHRYSITVPARVVRAVHELTAGNPYWVSLLATQMWLPAQKRELNRIAYDLDLLAQATDEVIGSPIPFLDRMGLNDDSASALPRQVLCLLADRQPAGLDRSAIRWTLARRQVSVTPEQVRDTLDDLSARGSVATFSHSSKLLWRVAAPLLGMYIRHREL